MSLALALAVHIGAANEALAGDARANDARASEAPASEVSPSGTPQVASSRGGASSLLERSPLADGTRRFSRADVPAFVDGLLRSNEALELLGAFVLPGRRGVTVATSDGVPTLSLSMMRTDITRGSGLCATARF